MRDELAYLATLILRYWWHCHSVTVWHDEEHYARAVDPMRFPSFEDIVLTRKQALEIIEFGGYLP